MTVPTEKPKYTSEEFREKNGGVCPMCGGGDICGQELPQHHGDCMTMDVACEDCGAWW